MKEKTTSATVAKTATNDKKVVSSPVSTPKTEEKAPLMVVKSEEKKEMEQPKEATPEPVKKFVTVPDMLAKVNELNSLMGKYNYVTSTKAKLASFSLGSSGLTDSFIIKDGEGHEFSTNNSNLISKILNVLKFEVNQACAEVEEQLRAAM